MSHVSMTSDSCVVLLQLRRVLVSCEGYSCHMWVCPEITVLNCCRWGFFFKKRNNQKIFCAPLLILLFWRQDENIPTVQTMRPLWPVFFLKSQKQKQLTTFGVDFVSYRFIGKDGVTSPVNPLKVISERAFDGVKFRYM